MVISLGLEESCENVLTKNIKIESLNRTQQLAWLSLVSKDDYEKNSRDIETSASYMGLASGALDYNDFNSRRSKYLQDQNFTFLRSENLNLFTSNVTAEQVQAWTQCMISKGFYGAKGLVKFYNYESRFVVIQFYYKPPAGRILSRKIHLVMDNCELAGGTIVPSTLEGESNLEWGFRWQDIKKPFVLAVNVDGLPTFDLNIPSYTPSPRPTQRTTPIETFIDPQQQLTQLGYVREGEIGYLEILGEWYYGEGEGALSVGDSNASIITCDLNTGNVVGGSPNKISNNSHDYYVIPGSRRIYIRINDNALLDNRTKITNPLRSRLYFNLPPGS